MYQYLTDRKVFRLILPALLALMSCMPAMAREVILDFDSRIEVFPDGSLTVTETIRVRAEGEQIRRGIYREFPTRYQDRLGNRYNVEFSVISVTRNGNPEPFHTEQRSNGVVVYMGSAGSYITAAVHTYELRYRTNRQLGYFDDYDELYWNVTGNGWIFPINRASASIILPGDGVPWQELKTAYYTGAEGTSGLDAEVSFPNARETRFRTTAALPANHGLTVALGWPKGITPEPDLLQRSKWFFADNGGALVLLLGLLFSVGWYLRSWHLHGRDPRKGVIIPRFEPPAGLSPAACRFILDMGLSNAAFTSAIISLGVKGHLKIDDSNDEYILYRNATGNEEVSEGEIAVLTELLPEEDSWIPLENEKHSEFQRAKYGLKAALKSEHQGRLFNLNTLFMLPAVLISVVAIIFGAIFKAGPLPWVLFAILSLAMHIGFLFLLRAPTPAGRRIMDEIEGFRMYLDTAEQWRLDRMRSPELTPELFEKFLPYAFALGVENKWCKNFEQNFPQEVSEYQPGWYHGNRRGLAALHHVGDGFSAGLSSAISSASTPPGSSSGSGGGGSSGGGGGGGGGGGW